MKKKISKKKALLIRGLLLMIILIAPFANAFRLFFTVLTELYFVSFICLIGLFVVDFYTEK